MIVGPLLARFGKGYIPKPGGDKIGRRRLDTHFEGFINLGAKFRYNREDHFYGVEVEGKLQGAYMLLDEASVTGTANIVMAAVLAQGISEKTGWHIDNSILKKIKYTHVQAQSNYSERLQNVFEAYQCVNATPCKNKKILIVDDVATTGATLQTCVDAILEKESDCTICIVTLAFTSFN